MLRAVLGGSFDPVHNGHVALVERVLADGLAGHVHLVPAARNPHKTGDHATAQQRLAMARLAFAGHASVSVETLEVERPAPSYTVDTLEVLAARYPDDQLRLLLGADNVAGLDRWKSLDRILELARPVVFSRPDQQENEAVVPGTGSLPGETLFLPDFQVEMSSTGIRAMVARGESVADFLPPAVAAYVADHTLYRN